MLLKLSVISFFCRSLGPNNELLLTWTNPNGEVIPLNMGYVTKYSNQLAAAVDLAATRAWFNYDQATIPAIVSQEKTHPTRILGCFELRWLLTLVLRSGCSLRTSLPAAGSFPKAFLTRC